MNPDLQPLQFTLSDLLARMIVLAMLISAWTWAVKSADHTPPEAGPAVQAPVVIPMPQETKERLAE